MNENKVIDFMNTEKYKDWFTCKLIDMILKLLKSSKDEGLTIDDLIQALEEGINENRKLLSKQ